MRTGPGGRRAGRHAPPGGSRRKPSSVRSGSGVPTTSDGILKMPWRCPRIGLSIGERPGSAPWRGTPTWLMDRAVCSLAGSPGPLGAGGPVGWARDVGNRHGYPDSGLPDERSDGTSEGDIEGADRYGQSAEGAGHDPRIRRGRRAGRPRDRPHSGDDFTDPSQERHAEGPNTRRRSVRSRWPTARRRRCRRPGRCWWYTGTARKWVHASRLPPRVRCRKGCSYVAMFGGRETHSVTGSPRRRTPSTASAEIPPVSSTGRMRQRARRSPESPSSPRDPKSV